MVEVSGLDGLRLLLMRCPKCGQHGVVVSYNRGGLYRVAMNVWTKAEVWDLHDRLLNAGGDYQYGFVGELQGASYLVDDFGPGQLTGLTVFMYNLDVPAPCEDMESAN